MHREMINGQYQQELQVSEGIQLKQVDMSKYLGVVINKGGFSKKEIEIRIQLD
jgi:hypothetical protein